MAWDTGNERDVMGPAFVAIYMNVIQNCFLDFNLLFFYVLEEWLWILALIKISEINTTKTPYPFLLLPQIGKKDRYLPIG